MRKGHLSSTPVLYESYYALRSASLGRSPPCLWVDVLLVSAPGIPVRRWLSSSLERHIPRKTHITFYYSSQPVDVKVPRLVGISSRQQVRVKEFTGRGGAGARKMD